MATGKNETGKAAATQPGRKDQVERSFVISRAFDAPRDLVFKVWTETDHLTKWWGPKGFTVFSCKNDLRPGGVFLYGLKTPNGDEMWGKWVFQEVVVPERLVFVSSFSNAAGGMMRHPYAPSWPLEILSTVSFSENDGKTAITLTWIPINATELERKTFDDGRAGMNQGWGGTFEQLGEYLTKRSI